MQLHNLPKANQKSKKRVGRGGKRGFTSGRGTKGQKARAGRKIRPSERDLIMKLPKKRGFSNNPKSPGPHILNVSDLERVLKSDSKDTVTVDVDVLYQKGLVPKRHRGPVKVLGKGEISVPIKLSGVQVSTGAKEKIEAAGGSVVRSAVPKNA